MIQGRGRDKFKKNKQILIFFSNVLKILPLRLRINLFYICRNIHGTIGIGIRYIFIKSIAKECGDNVSIQTGVYLLSPENVELGDNISIHPMCYIDCTGGIIIGNDVSIAHSSTILSSSHIYKEKNIPIKNQGIEYKQTIISNNVWIGNKVTVVFGVNVSSGSIIGANSVVTKDIDRNSVVAGIPAKEIKKRI